MSLPKGAKVKFLHSAQEGTVTEIIDEHMVSVYVEEWDMDLPVPVTDLLLADPTLLPGFQPSQIRHAPAVREAEHKPPAKARTGETGILLAFEPLTDKEGLPEKFRVFLLNDTSDGVLYNLDLYLLDERRFEKSGKLDSGQWAELGEIRYEELNDQPEAEAECWKIKKDGTGGRNFKLLRIKPKTFFSKLVHAPLLYRHAHVFTLFERLSDERKKGGEEDLQTYTRRHAPPAVVLMEPEDTHHRTPHEVREAAEFSLELDLHIEKLVEDPSHLTNAQIIQLQLRVFEDYMDKAIRLGMERVFIIHGLGKGRLRDAIASRLIRMPEVITFKNEFHPKYGHGATEVILIM